MTTGSIDMTTGSIDMSTATKDDLIDAVGKNANGLESGTDVTALIANNPPPPDLMESIRQTGMGGPKTGRGM